ncbi:hypothetical protein D3C83_53120 [compost metagenome]
MLQVFERRSETVPRCAPAIGKEEIAGESADQRADQRSRRHCRSFVHTTSLYRPSVEPSKIGATVDASRCFDFSRFRRYVPSNTERVEAERYVLQED